MKAFLSPSNRTALRFSHSTLPTLEAMYGNEKEGRNSGSHNVRYSGDAGSSKRTSSKGVEDATGRHSFKVSDELSGNTRKSNEPIVIADGANDGEHTKLTDMSLHKHDSKMNGASPDSPFSLVASRSYLKSSVNSGSSNSLRSDSSSTSNDSDQVDVESLDEDAKAQWIQKLLEYELLNKKAKEKGARGSDSELGPEYKNFESTLKALQQLQLLRQLELEDLFKSYEKWKSPDKDRQSSVGSIRPPNISKYPSAPPVPSPTAGPSSPAPLPSFPLSRSLSYSSSTNSIVPITNKEESSTSSGDSPWGTIKATLLNRSSPTPFKKHHRRKSSNSMSAGIKYLSCTPQKEEIVLSGHLMKRSSNKKWNKKWIVLTKTHFHCFKSESSHKAKSIDLRLSSFKCDTSALSFWIITPQLTHFFLADTTLKLNEWTKALESICNELMLDAIEKTEPTAAKTVGNSIMAELAVFLKTKENSVCADCGCKDPQWASISLGVFLCIECSGVHRSLGVSISKVRSVTLDVWEPDWIKRMQNIGNRKANEVWEAKLQPGQKVQEDCIYPQRADYIRRKYIFGEFKEESAQMQRNESLELRSVKDVFVYFDGDVECVGFVEVDTNKQLSELRSLMVDEGITSEDNSDHFKFLFKKAPVTEKQEKKKKIRDCIVKIDDSWTIMLRKCN